MLYRLNIYKDPIRQIFRGSFYPLSVVLILIGIEAEIIESIVGIHIRIGGCFLDGAVIPLVGDGATILLSVCFCV